MKNLRFDIDLWPKGALKNRSAVFQGANKSHSWSIGCRDGRSVLNRKHVGDVLQFGNVSPDAGWKRWLPKSVLVISNLTEPANEVARLDWKSEKGGLLSFSSGEWFSLARNKREAPAISGDCLRISVINHRSRLSVPVEFAGHAEALMIVAYSILIDELSD